jgi:hypothetical protein
MGIHPYQAEMIRTGEVFRTEPQSTAGSTSAPHKKGRKNRPLMVEGD